MDLSNVDLFAKLAGILGFIIALTLAAIRIIEFRRDRFQIVTSPAFTSDQYIGNTITLINPTNRPVVVSSWSLKWKKNRFPFRSKTTLEIDYGDPFDSRLFKIDAHGSHDIHFTEQDHFAWGSSMSKYGVLCIDLSIAGRRSVVSLKVYTPNS